MPQIKKKTTKFFGQNILNVKINVQIAFFHSKICLISTIIFTIVLIFIAWILWKKNSMSSIEERNSRGLILPLKEEKRTESKKLDVPNVEIGEDSIGRSTFVKNWLDAIFAIWSYRQLIWKNMWWNARNWRRKNWLIWMSSW